MTTPVAVALGLSAALLVAPAHADPLPPDHSPGPSAQPVADWSHEARRAIVPPGPGGVFGTDNYGHTFPGEAAVFMGIVHAAIYDAVLAIEGGYQPYAIALHAPKGTSAAAAVATAAHHVLTGLQPALGLTTDQQAALDARYAAYVAAIPDDDAKRDGVVVGARVAAAVLAKRAGDGRERNPRVEDLDPPPSAPGVWSAGAEPALGLRLPGLRPLSLARASQFRPHGPPALHTRAYRTDLAEVALLGRADSVARTPAQTAQALFWTDHDIRQWNDGMLAGAAEARLGLLDTARMLAMAHVAGGDAMIACFDAKYAYWFWRPIQAIKLGAADGSAGVPDPSWLPLRPTPNFPEYPSAHSCHSAAIAAALDAFAEGRPISFTLESRVTGTTHRFRGFEDAIADVIEARILAGFHFRSACEDGVVLGRRVGRYVARHEFRRLR